jgi:ComF family protein
VPVPLHRSRLRRRGYNQVLELAGSLARHLGVRVCRDALERNRATDAQTELSAVQRRRNVRGAFGARLEVELPAHVAVLDDVCTTGATLAECARVLKRAGVQRVDAWALARAPAH